MAVPICRTCGRCRQIAIQHRQLDLGIQQPQRLVVVDMLLRLRCKDVGQWVVMSDMGLFSEVEGDGSPSAEGRPPVCDLLGSGVERISGGNL